MTDPSAGRIWARMTYEYVCSACSFQWEAEQPISASPLTTCPSCKAESARRQVSGGQGFILRGGGWYADGYGSAKPAAAEAKPASAESKTAATPAKSDTPAAATPAAPRTPAKVDKPKPSS
ncbi:MAG: zinc ribbon domain-containing protein [Myxococcales bacterium]|nr:zinc ribbon domain-containing protein [Myxococcales bacterium]